MILCDNDKRLITFEPWISFSDWNILPRFTLCFCSGFHIFAGFLFFGFDFMWYGGKWYYHEDTKDEIKQIRDKK